MAKSGLLGLKSHSWSDRDFRPVVVYTVPSDVDHAVVHITIVPGALAQGVWRVRPNTANVTVNNIAVLSYSFSGVGYDPTFNTNEPNWIGFSNSLSMMLNPGDVVRLTPIAYTQGTAAVSVSGYEVDN